MWRKWGEALGIMRRRQSWETSLSEELESHIEHRADHLMAGGTPAEEARRQARLELGQHETYKEQCREAKGLRWPDELAQDLRFAFRSARHHRGFTTVAIVSLALGIGANTAVFSVLNSLVLQPLPMAEPERVFFVQHDKEPTHSFPLYRDLRDRNATFSALAAYRIAPMGRETAQGAERVWGYLATGNYFDLLGTKPILGRFFHPGDEKGPGASPYAVLSYACWRQRFAGDPGMAGRTVRINGRPYTVLGVAPREFHGTEHFYWPEIWVPMMMEPQIEMRDWLEDRNTWNAFVIGRLRPGITQQQAEANLDSVGLAVNQEHPSGGYVPRTRLARPGMIGDTGGAPVRGFLIGVMALAGLVLLAACANLAGLLSARSADRRREFAIRISIGAGRARLMRQLLTESMLLALAGGAAGCGLAYGLLSLLSEYRPPFDFPAQFAVKPDPRVMAFAVLITAVTGLLFGLAPVRQAWATETNRALRGAGSGRRWAFRDLLLAGQVCLCCLLVTACFVSLRGLSNALRMPAGFRSEGVTVAGFDLGIARYSADRGRQFQQEVLEKAKAVPGVVSAAFASAVPLTVDQSSTTLYAPGAMDDKRRDGVGASYFVVSPDYFSVMSTRLLAGRDFRWDDPPGMAIVNETLARKVLGRTDAVGRRIVHGFRGEQVLIIGVVEDGKYESLTEQPRAAIFWPAARRYESSGLLLVRSNRPESEMAGLLRQCIAELDARLPAQNVGGLRQQLSYAFFPARAASFALSAFGLLAMMLAVTGIHGLAAYSVSRRVREIGIRTAVGARPGQVLSFVLGRTGALIAAGCLGGLALGFVASQGMSRIVYQASARDPVVLAGVVVTMAVISLASVYVPARRALSIDPLQALRQE
ncbi:ABC transporter permease [Paludibaculum fermentans]|uniref:ABC transporter permease n=1 Tax=Paludibaculum fermentans TaxID=1473598 RepID=A0A7S7SHJ3_PALFE|nr:ABC transporter permease [Paludibaculum fermentans]QOY85014.1 ABC transporter permease [Paludibaculum fermentans]